MTRNNKKDMRKGQGAFEFLTTYGVMILVVVLLIGSLALVNYLGTGKFIPSSCSFASGFECSDFKVTTGAVTVELQNSFGETVNVNSLTVVRNDGSQCTVPGGIMVAGETKKFDVTGCNNGNIDEKFEGIVKVQYSIGGSNFNQIGELISRVEETSSTSTTSTTTSTTSSTSTSTSTSTTSTSTTTTTVVGYIKVLKPTAAIDNVYVEQVSPDNGPTDGTVDVSNNDARWLTVDGDNINVTAWNQTIPIGATVDNVTGTCEVDFANAGGGEMGFSWWNGATYSLWACTQHISTGGTYTCDLFANGLDTVAEVNNARLRCRGRDDGFPGAFGFSVDYMQIKVGYSI